MEEFEVLNPQPHSFKWIYGGLITLTIINLIGIGLNVGFIYTPEVRYAPELSEIMDNLNSVNDFIEDAQTVLTQVGNFINYTIPILNKVSDYICSDDPGVC